MLIVQSSIKNVYDNLAMEEVLLEQADACGPVFFLWQSDCAVVIGKNQNPWMECRLDLMEQEGVPLARRVSGGGTVYHDEGNLNYCVITNRTQYREAQAYELVFQALEKFGVQVATSGKSSLCVDGRKFSGNAFCFRKNRALHHGTLLVNTDLTRLNRYLGPMSGRIETHAVPSVPATVMNLGEGCRDITIGNLAGELSAAFETIYGDGSAAERWSEKDFSSGLFGPLLEKQNSNAWKYGATPRFEVGCNTGKLVVEGGMVMTAEGGVSESVEGRPFHEVAFSLLC
ncbi:MAG: lipoate--protein ligase family protein [Kiritimatiellales bacterium]|nr:lipoate--protein ligase family protein [Kiritimatiellales bacterium]